MYEKIFFHDDDCINLSINKLAGFFLILHIVFIMKLKSLVFNHEIIKLIEINDMGMLHSGEQP